MCWRLRLRAWLDALLWERGHDAPDVLRAKGVLALDARMERHVLQAVRSQLPVIVPSVCIP